MGFHKPRDLNKDPNILLSVFQGNTPYAIPIISRVWLVTHAPPSMLTKVQANLDF